MAPAELEGHILDHPDVSDVCVVGLADDYSGELPLAFITPSTAAEERMQKDPAEADRIRKSIAKVGRPSSYRAERTRLTATGTSSTQHVADHKVPYKHLAGGVEFVEVIPKNPSGKLLRRVLRDRANELKKQGKLSTPLRSKM